MRIVITGATGFIGRALCRELSGDYEVVALSRDSRRATEVLGPGVRVVEWDGRTTSGWAAEVAGAQAIINLAGENVATGRWSEATMNSIRQSRVHSTRAVLDALEGAPSKPEVFVQASGIGYYGACGDETLDEDAPVGEGFLADVGRQAEVEAARSEALGVRCVILRTGVVLGREGGALPKLMRPFRFYVGGHLGSGRQWFSWISLRDEVRAIRFLLEDGAARGAFNLTAPGSVTMKAFCRSLGEAMGRPAWTVVPGPVLRLLLGKMADELLLGGQRVMPKRLTEVGFTFEHSTAGAALAAIIRGESHEHGSA